MNKDNYTHVDPVNTKRYEGRVDKDHYTFGKVFIDDIPRGFSQKNVEFKKGRDYIRWEYKGKTPILIGEDGVYCGDDVDMEEARNQAYFALSILADEGYVSAWSKR